MTKSWFIGTTALVLLASGAYAADAPAPADAPPAPHEGMGHGHHPADWVPYDQLTLEQARKHAHDKADELDKMTPAQWEAHKKEMMAHKAEREAHKAKWEAMTPEERQKEKDAWKSRHAQDHAEKTGAAPAADDKPVEK